MTNKDFSISIVVNQSASIVFNAILDVDAWWTGTNDGQPLKVGDKFVHQYKSAHYCKLRVKRSKPGNEIVWHIDYNYFKDISDKSEWTDTNLVFTISTQGRKTKLTFRHDGLVPQMECYKFCAQAWTSLIKENLVGSISKGTSRRDVKSNSKLIASRE